MLPSLTRRNFGSFYLPGLFEDDYFPVFNSRNDSMPAVNIREDEKSYTLDLAVPGIDKKDLNIDVKDDVLTISSELKSETENSTNGFKRKEFSYSSFCRSFQIPENVDQNKIGANYKDGILSVDLPKLKEDTTKITRQIKVS